MRIQKVQSNQQTFGTKVQITKVIADNFVSKGKAEEMVQEIRILEHNGVADKLSVRDYRGGDYIEAYVTEHIDKNKICVRTIINDIISFKDDAKFSIIKLYADAKKKAGKVIELEEGYEDFLPYIV